MSGFGGMLTIEVNGDGETAAAVADRFELFAIALGLGGVESLATRPVTTTHHGLTPLKGHMDHAVDEGIDLQDAIGAVDQSPWSDLADFNALAGRNAHQAYLQSEAAAFE